MTADPTAAVAAPAATAVRATRASLGMRLADRLNPILVREIQQFTNGRVFLLTLLLALTGVLIIATVMSFDAVHEAASGREGFMATVMTMGPIVIFIVPFQAFVSMRREVSGGTTELLLLSRLTPGAIVRGKLLAAMVHFLVYLSVFAPLMGLTFLLRGLDVPLIAMVLVMALLACLCASSLAIAIGALARWQLATPLFYGLASMALGGATAGFMGGTVGIVEEYEWLMRHGHMLEAFGSALLGIVASMVLLSLVAMSMLTHPHENRSTPFRLFYLLFVLGGTAWVMAIVPRTELGDALVVSGFIMLLAGIPFWLFAVTEDTALSPRVRTLVPRSGPLAMLAVPWLPGGGRGFLFLLTTGSLPLIVSLGLPHALGTSPGHGDVAEVRRVIALIAAYVVFYLGLTAWIRRRLRPGPMGTWIARVLLFVLVLAGSLLPVLLEVLMAGRVHSWSVIHALNPIWTTVEVAMMRNRIPGSMVLAGVLAAAGFVLNAAAVNAGIGEVQDAAAARRRLLARAPAAAAGEGPGPGGDRAP